MSKENNDARSAGRSPERLASSPKKRFWPEHKAEIVLRLLKGESLDELSREIQVPAGDISEWRDDFIYGGAANLKRRKEDPLESKLKEAQAKIGDLSMRLDIAQTYLKKKGVQL
jgi:transposase